MLSPAVKPSADRSPLRSPARISVVIPSFNEALRLPGTLAALAERRDDFAQIELGEVIVVDDGSSDGTHEVAADHVADLPSLQVVRHAENRGKGRAVRSGIARARHPWILVADADLATPWSEVDRLVGAALRTDLDLVIGSRREAHGSTAVDRTLLRRGMGRSFNLLVRLLLRLPFRDTQCGFKLLRRRAVLPLLDGLRVDRFAWDVELLVAAVDSGLAIDEVPVRWRHRDASRVRVVPDSWSMARSVARVWLRRCLGRFPTTSVEVAGPGR